MTFYLKFISIFTASVLTGVLVYSTHGMQGFPHWDDLWLMDSLSPALDPVPSKKKMVSKKPVQMKPFVPKSKQQYTFFEILMDTQLVKQVDLGGELMEIPSRVSDSFPKRDKPSSKIASKRSVPPVLDSLNREKSQSHSQTGLKWIETLNISEDLFESEPQFFLVQAGSFKNLEYAQTMVRKLKKKGYNPFMQRIESKTKNQFWYRIYLGHFKEKEKALEMVHLLRSQERLDPIVVLWKK